MALAPGTRLGPYEVVALIGTGGMGEVYRARDTRLDRTVALKVLPSHVAADPERRQRFEREARVVSGLDHPHICRLYDLGEQGDVSFLVMEHLAGETLAQRLTKGPLPLEQVLQHGIQIAEALDAAHAKGVVHRDLKPGNIMLTKTGAKLLDFGLAKLKAHGEQPVVASASSTPTATEPLTDEGTILGTLQYMAPEQLEGRPADPRTDAFAFGVVLYEMATGRKAFEGQSHASLIAAILDAQPPPVSAVQSASPRALDRVVRTCLAKDPEERWQSLRDVSRQLRWIAESEDEAIAKRSPQGARRLRLAWTIAVAGLLLGVWGATTLIRQPQQASTPQVAMRLAVELPSPASLFLMELPSLAVTRDGRRLVYAAEAEGTPRLYVRDLDRPQTLPLAGTEGGSGPFFSPDGQWVGFFADRKLKKVAIAGGPPVTLCEAPTPRGGSWEADGTIFFTPAPGAGLWRIAAERGTPERVTQPHRSRGELTHRWAHLLPTGTDVLFTLRTATQASFDEAQIAVLSLKTGQWRVVLDGGTFARYAEPGYVLYARAGTLLAVPFDLSRLEVTGPAALVVPDLALEDSTGAAHFAMSERGLLVFASGGKRISQRALVWVDRQNVTRPVLEARRAYLSPRISPDGRHIVMTIQEANDNIWTYDLVDATLNRRTFESGSNVAPIWTSDGKRITFSSNRAGAYTLFGGPVDGSASEQLLAPGDHPRFPGSWSPDGRFLAFIDSHPTTGSDIWVMPADGSGTARPFLQTPADERDPEFSPDGRWLAYTSNESGRAEVYVQSVAGPPQRTQVSTDGGNEPLWAASRRELLYRAGDSIMLAPIEAQPRFRVGKPRLVLQRKFERDVVGGVRNWDVARDGQRFLVITRDERSGPSSVQIVVNWLDQFRLRERMPSSR